MSAARPSAPSLRAGTTPTMAMWRKRLDMCGPSAADLASIAEELGLHELAVEDAVEDHHQRPKLDHYDTHAFLTTYAAQVDTDTGTLTLAELAVFITDQALVTVRKDDH